MMHSRALAFTACVAVAALTATSASAQRGFGGRGGGPPPGPPPRDEAGKIMLDGATTDTTGVWTPNFGISDPVAPIETVPFQPWAAALYEDRQQHELEPGTYVMLLQLAASSPSVWARPALVGTQAPPTDPPAEVIQTYLTMERNSQ